MSPMLIIIKGHLLPLFLLSFHLFLSGSVSLLDLSVSTSSPRVFWWPGFQVTVAAANLGNVNKLPVTNKVPPDRICALVLAPTRNDPVGLAVAWGLMSG